jgi:hypothetical protein
MRHPSLTYEEPLVKIRLNPDANRKYTVKLTQRVHGMPALDLLYNRLNVRQLTQIVKGGHSFSANNTINFFLCPTLNIGVGRKSEKEG